MLRFRRHARLRHQSMDMSPRALPTLSHDLLYCDRS